MINIKVYHYFLASLFFSTPAVANLRAPMWIPSLPSQSAGRPAQGVVATGERLRFRCDGPACEVLATYFVSAHSPLKATMRFVLPTDSEVIAIAGEAETRVVPQPLKLDETLLQRYKWLRDAEDWQKRLYEARFDVTFPQGASTVEVRYMQPLSLYEASHGYIMPSSYVYDLDYELWPLREWIASDNFQLEIEIGIKKPDGFFARVFGCTPSPSCNGVDLVAKGADDDWEWHRSVLGESFPDRLHCEIDAPSDQTKWPKGKPTYGGRR